MQLKVVCKRLVNGIPQANEETIKALQQLMARKDGLSELAGIKQDAQDFGYNKMLGERHKRSILEPLYREKRTSGSVLMKANSGTVRR